MANYKSAVKEAQSLCGPTCPDVDRAFDELKTAVRDLVPPLLTGDAESAIEACCAKVKDVGTEKLRSALVDACSEKQQAEEERDAWHKEAESLRDEVSSLRAEINAMESA